MGFEPARAEHSAKGTAKRGGKEKERKNEKCAGSIPDWNMSQLTQTLTKCYEFIKYRLKTDTNRIGKNNNALL